MTSPGTGPPAKRPATVPERIAPEVAELHAAGLGRNAIARRLGRSETSVTRAADLAGVTFDGDATADATRARARQIADQLAGTASTLAEVAQASARRWLIEVKAEVLDPQAVRALAISTGVSFDKVASYLAAAPDESQAEAFDELASLADNILTAADAYIGDPTVPAAPADHPTEGNPS